MPPRRRLSVVDPREVIRVVLIVVAVVGVLYVIFLLRTPLAWLVIAAFVAVALSGLVNFLSRRLPRWLAIVLAYLTIVLVPALVVAVVVPPLVREGNGLAQNVPAYARDVQRFVTENATLRKLEQDYGITKRLQEEASKLPGKLPDAASALGDLGAGVLSSVFAGVNILILSIFMVVGGRGWLQRAIRLAPEENRERLNRTLDRIGRATGAYVGGAIAQALIAGLSTFIVLTILGVPFAAPLAVIVGLFDLIPLVGATLAAILVALVTLFTDFPVATVVWVVWAIAYQQLENNVLQPQIQRRAVDVHPFVVLVSVLFGSTLFGIVGALLAIPLAASAQIALAEFLEYRNEIRTGGEDRADEQPAPG